MSLRHGREFFAMPGPSVIPDRVLQAMHRPAPDIYGDMLAELTDGIITDLRAVARSADAKVALNISNGHGVWEAALANTLAPGARVLVLITGRFGLGWAETARTMGHEVELLSFPPDRAADPQGLADHLAQTGRRYDAILTTQTDTATSAQSDIEALSPVIRAALPDTLLMVDCIASLGCERFEMDLWDVDVMLAASQKGLMTPPGMGFCFVRDRALAARRRLDRVSPYWDWLPRFAPELYYQHFCGTAPTQHLFGLRAALDMLVHEEGIEAAWARHDAIARTVWAAVSVWSELGAIRLNIPDPGERSRAVSTVHTAPGDAPRLRQWCKEEAGVTLGVGLGLGAALSPPTDGLLRIAHMGHVNAPTILGILASMDAGLKALGIEHGGGALRVASETIAAHLRAG